MPGILHSAAKFALHRAGGLRVARWVNRGGLRILMYHRFHDRAALARQCAYIRANYRPVSMTAVSEWLHDGRALPPYAVAVTVDDGYRDFAEVAHPVFAEYGIPVTVYLVTDFLDGKLWLWFDRVQYAFSHARGEVGEGTAEMAATWSEADRRRWVDELPARLRVEIPERSPAEYAPLSWDSVRALAANGVEFGAHTKTHPILSGVVDDVELRDEIAGSQRRMERELNRPVLHFCYPNGKMRDIGPRVVEAVRAAGMRTAVTAEPGLNRAGREALLLQRIAADPGHAEDYFRQGLAGLRGS
jgi:peptidoglycan/xylan/chitin deacetylase (PgdA/CDA1 family)